MHSIFLKSLVRKKRSLKKKKRLRKFPDTLRKVFVTLNIKENNTFASIALDTRDNVLKYFTLGVTGKKNQSYNYNYFYLHRNVTSEVLNFLREDPRVHFPFRVFVYPKGPSEEIAAFVDFLDNGLWRYNLLFNKIQLKAIAKTFFDKNCTRDPYYELYLRPILFKVMIPVSKAFNGCRPKKLRRVKKKVTYRKIKK